MLTMSYRLLAKVSTSMEDSYSPSQGGAVLRWLGIAQGAHTGYREVFTGPSPVEKVVIVDVARESYA